MQQFTNQKQLEKQICTQVFSLKSKELRTAEMKYKSGLRIKKKIKKIIHIIIVEEHQLSSPHNTNQYLLTKHEYQKINQDKECPPPGSMLQFLLKSDKIIQSQSDTNIYEQIKKILQTN
ncbi:unnamed protein product [Paramecium octaurelia]|uniref:Uncharacterized protein n=1 Tax=Paramecium octaurelia TaxID=43137 RepID=A0A8S1SWX1_PAROT|nr:unnamed protein product [Paramecium octaurelia]